MSLPDQLLPPCFVGRGCHHVLGCRRDKGAAAESGNKNQAKARPQKHQDAVGTAGAFLPPKPQTRVLLLSESPRRCSGQSRAATFPFLERLWSKAGQRSRAFPPTPGVGGRRNAGRGGGNRAPPSLSSAFRTCPTCSRASQGQQHPWPEPSGQPNQPGQVWAGIFGVAVTAPRPRPAWLPARRCPSAPRRGPGKRGRGFAWHRTGCSGTPQLLAGPPCPRQT